ncbi:MAG TPA: hypothetical protein VGL95_08985, partial [Acetobacteraceae bacterium]
MTGSRHLGGGAGMDSPGPDAGGTVRDSQAAKKPPLLTRRRAWLAGAGILGTACLLRGVGSLVLSPRPSPVATAAVRVPLAPLVAPPAPVTPAPAPRPVPE